MEIKKDEYRMKGGRKGGGVCPMGGCVLCLLYIIRRGKGRGLLLRERGVIH